VQCGWNKIVQPFADQFAPAFLVAKHGRAVLSAAMTFAADSLEDLCAGLLLGESGERKAAHDGEEGGGMKAHEMFPRVIGIRILN
jgi:hypothetical protein